MKITVFKLKLCCPSFFSANNPGEVSFRLFLYRQQFRICFQAIWAFQECLLLYEKIVQQNHSQCPLNMIFCLHSQRISNECSSPSNICKEKSYFLHFHQFSLVLLYCFCRYQILLMVLVSISA